MLAVLEDGGDSETVRLELHDSILGDSARGGAQDTLVAFIDMLPWVPPVLVGRSVSESEPDGTR